MTPAQTVAHNFWAQATKVGIYDASTGLPELLDLLISEYEEEFADALERSGYTVTKD